MLSTTWSTFTLSRGVHDSGRWFVVAHLRAGELREMMKLSVTVPGLNGIVRHKGLPILPQDPPDAVRPPPRFSVTKLWHYPTGSIHHSLRAASLCLTNIRMHFSMLLNRNMLHPVDVRMVGMPVLFLSQHHCLCVAYSSPWWVYFGVVLLFFYVKCLWGYITHWLDRSTFFFHTKHTMEGFQLFCCVMPRDMW